MSGGQFPKPTCRFGVNLHPRIRGGPVAEELNSFGIGQFRLFGSTGVELGPIFEELKRDCARQEMILVLAINGGVLNAFGQNWTLENWREYVGMMVNANPEVRIWEVTNESWNAASLNWTGHLSHGDPKAYFEILRDAYDIIKKKNNENLVLALGGNPTFQDWEIWLFNQAKFRQEKYFQWASSIWSYGANQFCDGISLHPYSGKRWLPNEYPSDPKGLFSKLTLGEIWASMIQTYYELTGKPIWFTETGMPINNGIPPVAHLNNSSEKQALFLRQSFALLSNFTYSRGVYWWNLFGPSEQGLEFGLLNADHSPRPSLSAFQGFASNFWRDGETLPK